MKFYPLTKRAPRSRGRSLHQLFRVMKLTALLLTIAILQVSAKVVAQKVTLNEKQVSLDKIFKDIRLQTGYDFLVDDGLVEKTDPITISVKNADLKDVLNIVIQPPLAYDVVNNTVVVKQQAPTILDKIKKALVLPADISGTVTDTLGDPFPRASVKLEGTTYITITDENGNFIFKGLPEGTYKIAISYIGYEKLVKTVNLEGKTIRIKLILHSALSQLDQVHVIAYGTTTQRFNVGSISKVSSAEIEEQPITNLLEALEGRVPGLLVTQSGGVPGSAVSMQVRGQNSISFGAHIGIPLDNPLILIDGVPFSPQNASIDQIQSAETVDETVINNVQGLSAFNSINPADIESVEILRDADATAIYGSRGSNGVILITTKRGKAGKTKLDANVWSGESQATRTMPMMNTQQYLLMRSEALKNDGLSASSDPTDPGYAPDLTIFDPNRNTDWTKYFIGGMGHTTDANASISGGSEGTQFLIGSGFHREGYILPGNYADERVSVNANIHHTSSDKRLTVDFSVNYDAENNNSTSGTSLLNIFLLPPNYPALLNPDGSLNWNYKGVDLGMNPSSYLQQKYTMQTRNLLSHFQVGYEVLPGLNIRSSFGYNTVSTNENGQIPASSLDPATNPQSSDDIGTDNFETWIIEPQAEYKKQFGKGKLDILAGGTFQQNKTTTTYLSGQDFANDALIGSISAAGTIHAGNGYDLYKYNGIFGKINYIWDNKYIIDLTGRRDASSRFGPGHQVGNFGSVAGGWLFSEENAVKNAIPALSYGKLKASYGTTGNDNVTDYQYQPNYGVSNYGFTYQGIPGYEPLNLYNPDYSWAVNKKLELGMNLGFLSDHILAGIDWFRNRCGNQLISYQLPSQTGFLSVVQNFPAVVQNTGLEFDLSGNVKSKIFSWSVSANLTIPKNELLSFPGLENSNYASYYVIGQSTNIQRLYNYAGVNPSTGTFQFRTSTGALTTTPSFQNDLTKTANLDPKFYGGFSNTFSYKSFRLNIFMEFRKQTGYNYLGQIYSASISGTPGSLYTNEPVALLSRWQKPGDVTNITKFSTNTDYGAAYYFSKSTGAFSDASYIRVKTLSFSYNLPAAYLQKIKVQACKIYLNAQNLFTITGYAGNDPESQNFYGFPPLKTIVLGIQFTL